MLLKTFKNLLNLSLWLQRTHIDPIVFCDSSAMFAQYTERHALFQKDPHLVLVLQIHLEVTQTQYMGNRAATARNVKAMESCYVRYIFSVTDERINS